jgi:hypothetical protein
MDGAPRGARRRVSPGYVVAECEPTEFEGAPAPFRQALVLTETLSMRRSSPTATSASAVSGAVRPIGVKAAQHLTTAATMYRELDMRFWLERPATELTESSAALPEIVSGRAGDRPFGPHVGLKDQRATACTVTR